MTASSQKSFCQNEEPPLPQRSFSVGLDKINQLKVKLKNHLIAGSFLFAERRKNAR